MHKVYSQSALRPGSGFVRAAVGALSTVGCSGGAPLGDVDCCDELIRRQLPHDDTVYCIDGGQSEDEMRCAGERGVKVGRMPGTVVGGGAQSQRQELLVGASTALPYVCT